mgnify:CR=1 FL=1
MSDISAPSGGKNDSNKGIGDAKFQRGSGQGRRKGRPFLKGRQVKPTALEEVKNVLGRRPRRRELLIEYLHLFQDKFGHLSSAHLAALAHEMKMAMAVGKKRRYRLFDILPRHFLQTAELCGMGESIVQEIFTELLKDSDNAIEKTVAAMPKGFPASITDSIIGGYKARLPQIERFLS